MTHYGCSQNKMCVRNRLSSAFLLRLFVRMKLEQLIVMDKITVHPILILREETHDDGNITRLLPELQAKTGRNLAAIQCCMPRR